jgi:Putative transposase
MPALWRERQRQLVQHDWVVYAKAPLGGSAQVLDYLSRYTHRAAIGNERIKAITPTEVVFTVRADERSGKRMQRLAGVEFIRRFMQHVLPTGIKRIRHYGVLASACKGDQAAPGTAGLGHASLKAHSKARSAFQRPHCGGKAYARGRALGDIHLQKASLLGP